MSLPTGLEVWIGGPATGQMYIGGRSSRPVPAAAVPPPIGRFYDCCAAARLFRYAYLNIRVPAPPPPPSAERSRPFKAALSAIVRGCAAMRGEQRPSRHITPALLSCASRRERPSTGRRPARCCIRSNFLYLPLRAQ